MTDTGRHEGDDAPSDATAARGFVLYVGVDEAKSQAAGTDLKTLVQALSEHVVRIVPTAETYSTVAFAPIGAGGRDIDIVRLALREPTARARRRPSGPEAPERTDDVGPAIIDISRGKVSIGEEPVHVTYREFELLRALVLREGRTVHRQELVDLIWRAEDPTSSPNVRTIDVHVRRLRSKLGPYKDAVRTIRGSGYRFDRHPDVVVRFDGGPSPDLI